MADDLKQVEKWRQKAEECRAVGSQMQLPTARLSFEQMATTYDQLADSLEARLQGRQQQKPQTG
jgi:hypothetical protein